MRVTLYIIQYETLFFFLKDLYSAQAVLTGDPECPVIFNNYKESDLFYEHMTEEWIIIVRNSSPVENEMTHRFRQMLRTDIEEMQKICFKNDQGVYIHLNLNVTRNHTPIDPADLTRTETFYLQQFIRVQYHLLIFLRDSMQEEKPPVFKYFRWIAEKGQLLELLDAFLIYIRPTCPQGTMKCWFETICSMLQVDCPTNLNQELQKKRNRNTPHRFLQDLAKKYLDRCQKVK